MQMLQLPYQTTVIITYQLSSSRITWYSGNRGTRLYSYFVPSRRAVMSAGGAQPKPHSAATWHENSIRRGLCACVCQCQTVSVCVSVLTPEIFCYSDAHDTLHQYIKCCIKDRPTFRCTRNLLPSFLAVFLYVRSVFF